MKVKDRVAADGLRYVSNLRSLFKRYIRIWKAEEKSHRYGLVTLFCFGFALRVAFLFQPMHYDEAYNFLVFASRSLPIGLSYYPLPNNHLFQTFLMHLTTKTFGNYPLTIRLPAFIAGVLIIPATYLVVRKLFNKHAAILATALVVASSLLISFSTNARGYTIQALIFLILILVAIYIKRTDSRVGWISFVILSALGFYTIPTMLYFFGAVVIWMLLSAVYHDTSITRWAFIKKLTKYCFATVILVAILYLPAFIVSGVKTVIANDLVPRVSFSYFFRGFPGFTKSVWTAWNVSIPIVLSVILAIGFICSIIFHRKISRHRVNLAVVILGWCLLMILIQRMHPFARIWIPLMPLYFGFASAGLCYLGSRFLRLFKRTRMGRSRISPVVFTVFVLIVAVWLGTIVLSTQSPYQTEELGTVGLSIFRGAEQVALELKDTLKPGDIVYSDGYAGVPLEYYFDKNGIPSGYLYPNLKGAAVTSPDRVKRVFLVAGEEEEGHSLDDALSRAVRHGGLEKEGSYDLDQSIELDHSKIVIIELR